MCHDTGLCVLAMGTQRRQKTGKESFGEAGNSGRVLSGKQQVFTAMLLDISDDPNKEGSDRELTCWSPNPHVLQNVAAFKEIMIKLKQSQLASLSQEPIAKEAQRYKDKRLCEDSVRPPASQGPLVPLCFWDWPLSHGRPYSLCVGFAK